MRGTNQAGQRKAMYAKKGQGGGIRDREIENRPHTKEYKKEIAKKVKHQLLNATTDAEMKEVIGDTNFEKYPIEKLERIIKSNGGR